MKIIRVLLLFFVLSFSMIAKGQDDLKRVGIDISLEQLLNYYSYDLHPTNA